MKGNPWPDLEHLTEVHGWRKGGAEIALGRGDHDELHAFVHEHGLLPTPHEHEEGYLVRVPEDRYLVSDHVLGEHSHASCRRCGCVVDEWEIHDKKCWSDVLS